MMPCFVYEKGDTFIGLYVAYWKPGTASYRWAGAHAGHLLGPQRLELRGVATACP